MRVPATVILVLLVLPSSAAAAELRMHTRELTVSGRLFASATAPARFNLVGVSSRGSGSVSFRTRAASGRWSAWRPAAPEPEDVPDRPQLWRLGNPYWTGPSRAIQYRLTGRVARLRTTFVWSVADAVPLRRLALAGVPAMIPRRAWAGSDTALRRDQPRYADELRFAVVHHTAGASPANPAQSISIVRAVAAYHVRSNGWDDIGYNFLVDRFGQIFEGRYGGIDRNVIGAHAQGFNTGSVGVALIGTYSSAAPTAAARDALARLLAWRLDVAHVDPLSMSTHLSNGNPKYPAGVPVFLRAVAGHRDTGFTSCPGDRVYGLLASIARMAAATGTPKLYEPRVEGKPGGLVRFTARLSSSLPWRVAITDEDGGDVTEGIGSGTAVDWTWDARAALPGRYTWKIDAGPTVRPASGTLIGGAAALTIAASANPTVVSPDGDGRGDTAAVRYRVGRTSTVTVTVLDSLGFVLATLPQGQRAAGAHTFTWTADALPDGAYQLVFAAQSGVEQVSVTVPVGVNRTLARLAVLPAAFSPNGDGRLDTLAISFALTQPAEVMVEAQRRGTTPVTLSAGPLAPGDHTLAWAGEQEPFILAPDGTYSLVVRAVNTIGTVTQTAPVVLDTRPPTLRRVSRKPLRVRVNEAVTLRLRADGRALARVIPRAGVVRLFVRGTRVTAYAEDRAANRSPTLRLR